MRGVSESTDATGMEKDVGEGGQGAMHDGERMEREDGRADS